MLLKVEQGLISLKNFPLKNVVKNSLQKKNQFELPKSLTKNRSDKLLVKFKEKIQKDQEMQKIFRRCLALKQILENILSKDFFYL